MQFAWVCLKLLVCHVGLAYYGIINTFNTDIQQVKR